MREKRFERRIIGVIRVEGGDLGGGRLGIVVSELQERKVIDPIILLVRAIASDELFDNLVGALCLSVRLRVISGGGLHLDLEEFHQMLKEVGNEDGTAIGDDGLREAMETEDVGEKEEGKIGSGNGFDRWDEVRLLGHAAHNSPNRVASTRARELNNKVHGDGQPGTCGDLEWLEQAIRFVTRDLGPLASIAPGDIFPNIGTDTGPGIVAEDQIEGSSASWMSSDR